MIKSEEKVIHGEKYTVTEMDGITAVSVQARLMKLLGGNISHFQDIEDKTILEIISPIIESADPEDITELVKLLFKKGVIVHKKDPNGTEYTESVEIEKHFSGKNSLKIWEVVSFIIVVNFGLGE